MSVADPSLSAWRSLVDLDRLAAWMDERGLETGKPIEEAERPPGGTQNILIRFRRGDRWFMLRRPPMSPRMNGSETMRREARVLGALAGSDVPHPGLIAGCPDEDVLGAAFYLMEPIDGFNATVGLPPLHAGSPQVRREMGLSLVDGIAALGRVDHERLRRLDDPVGGSRGRRALGPGPRRRVPRAPGGPLEEATRQLQRV